jgi:eukaryotic-like serine/threonine-protein kinase
VHGLGSEVRDAYDDTAEPGTVLRTDPGAGEKVHNHGTVIVYVCRGPAEVTIPKNLIGMSEGEARAALTRGFLDFSHDDTQYNDDVPLGHVISTSPAPGTTVPNGTQVTLLVSNGPFPVTVPNVTNKPLAEATAQLDGLGLKVNVTWEYNDTVPAGSVIRQNPTAGSTSRHKATVTLVVSQVPVPDVIGKREEEARQILEDAGYTVQVDKVLGGVFGVVRGQNPGGGTRAPRGSTVTISVV